MFSRGKKGEGLSATDINWPQDWLISEIDERLKKEGKFTADLL